MLNDLFKHPRHLVQQRVESMLKQVETVAVGAFRVKREFPTFNQGELYESSTRTCSIIED